MSSKTTNFNLHKINLTDAPPDITVLNQNWDILDNELNELVTDSENDIKYYKSLDQLELTEATATTNAIIQAMKSNSLAVLEVNTNWTAATEIPDKYTTMVLYKRFNGRTSGILTSVASQNQWFGSQHSGGVFAGWKKLYGEHNTSTMLTALSSSGMLRKQTFSYSGTGGEKSRSFTFDFEPILLAVVQADTMVWSGWNSPWVTDGIMTVLPQGDITYGNYVSTTDHSATLTVTKSGTKITLNNAAPSYSAIDGAAVNTSGKTYYVIAFG